LTLDRFNLIRPALGLLPPEFAHRVTIKALRLGLAGQARAPDDPILAIDCFGLHFGNPVGMAAGFDKNAEVIKGALGLGFGFVEFGTVTPRPQRGNPRPRIFRLPEQRAIINRLGFNNDGLDKACDHVARWRKSSKPKGPVGGNIGRNKDAPDAIADYVTCAKRLSPLVDYLTVNVSSPNTPGLRALQSRAALTEILHAVKDACLRPVPVLVKIAPDLIVAELEDIALAVADSSIDGIIVTNTTLQRPDGLPPDLAAQGGGLSGKPLFSLATDVLRHMYRLTEGRVPLIGAGGISSADDAYTKIRAGASLLQLYTALTYQGPRLIGRIKSGLAERLKADGYARLQDAVGADVR
jgi:dihydroorotate dehydrogenase